LGSEWKVQIPIILANGASRFLVSPLNLSASGANQRLSKILGQNGCLVLVSQREKYVGEVAAFDVVRGRKGTTARKLLGDEMPWLETRKKISSLLYFISTDLADQIKPVDLREDWKSASSSKSPGFSSYHGNNWSGLVSKSPRKNPAKIERDGGI